uniref:Uncharacterized protein n=1 Tax=Anopheles arabiensis TaxID=7173 RepID=A0A182HK73_ANOAR
MQPTIPQSTGGSDMDLPAVQPMDWLFKKERIYLLAQFWQQCFERIGVANDDCSAAAPPNDLITAEPAALSTGDSDTI